MQRSDAVRLAVLRFYDRFSASDIGSFDEIVSAEEAISIGTAPGDWFTTNEQLKRGFAAEAARIEPGDLQAWEEGTIGWFADEPTVRFPETDPLPARLTGVLRLEQSRWKLVSTHLSIGVPDETMPSLAGRVR